MPIFDTAFRGPDGRDHGELAIADDAVHALSCARQRLAWILALEPEELHPVRCAAIDAAAAEALAPLLDEDDRIGTHHAEALP